MPGSGPMGRYDPAVPADLAAIQAALGIYPPIYHDARLAAIGTSLTSAAFVVDPASGTPNQYVSNSTGWVHWLECLSRGQFRAVQALTKGVAGNTTSQMLARFDADIMSNIDLFDVLVIEGGVNDYVNGIMFDQTLANFQTMAAKVRSKGKPVLVLGDWPRSYWTGVSNPAAYKRNAAATNRELSVWSYKTPGVAFIDPWNDLVNIADGNPDTGVTFDGLHLSTQGAFRVGKRVLASVGGSYYAQSPMVWSSVDTYDAVTNPRGNILPNPAFVGATGTVQNVAAGSTAPTSWQVQRFSGTDVAGVATSQQAGAQGYDGDGGNKHVVTLNTTAAWSGALLKCANITPPSSWLGQAIEASIDLDVASLSSITALQLYAYYKDGSGADHYTKCLNLGETGPISNYPTFTRGRWRTPPLTISADATAIWLLFTATVPAGATGTLKLYNPNLRPAT